MKEDMERPKIEVKLMRVNLETKEIVLEKPFRFDTEAELDAFNEGIEAAQAGECYTERVE